MSQLRRLKHLLKKGDNKLMEDYGKSSSTFLLDVLIFALNHQGMSEAEMAKDKEAFIESRLRGEMYSDNLMGLPLNTKANYRDSYFYPKTYVKRY